MKDDFAVGRFNRHQRELADETHLMLNIHLQIVAAEKGISERQYFGQFCRRESVVNIIRESSLQTAMRVIPQCAAAIYESLVNASNFGDMRMSGNSFAIGQRKPQVCGIRAERDFRSRSPKQ